MKQWIIAMVVLSAVCCSQASLIVNGDMSSTIYATGGNNATATDIDAGWAVKSTSGISLSETPGVITWNGTTDTLIADALTQINSVSTESGSSLTLSFDWTAVAGSTASNLKYQVVGWKATGDPELGTSTLFNNINGATVKVSGISTDDSNYLTAYDLLDDSTAGTTGSADFSTALCYGTAGSTASTSINIDIAGFAAGLNDVSDYDYIGVRFWIDEAVATDNANGSTLDNVSLVVPEPATLGLLGLGGLITLLVHRMKRK